MYISEVSGHHSATLAIEKAIKALRPDTEILNINGFHYTNPISERIVNRLYMGIIKATPQIWDYLYDNAEVLKNINKIKETIHKFNSPKLKKLFDNFNPDVVLCTQAFPCGMVADYKRSFNAKFSLVAVLTDFVPHSYWIYDSVDYFITPNEDISLRLQKKGVAPEKIKALGIPLDHEFNNHLDKGQIMQKYRLQEGVPVVLIMGGGQGLGPIKKIVKSLETVTKDIQEIIVTGTNKKLYRSLKRKAKKSRKKILLFRYTDKINELMTAATVIITKPGGITTAEILTKKVPAIIIKPLPGQEASNAAYLIEKKAAIRLDEPKEINVIMEELLAEPAKLKKLSQAARNIGKPNASIDIARLLLHLS
jgi:processive 1,2-diacylglycerol beta-glucosyltransferase